MANFLYLFLLAISIAYLIILLFFFKKHVSIFYLVTAICIIVIDFGYYELSIADNLATALSANRIVYLGSSFIVYFMVMSISEICNFTIPRKVKGISITMGAIVMACVFTIGKSPIYYASVDIDTYRGMTYLVKEYGTLHNIYPIYLVGMLVYGTVMIVNAFFKKKKVSYISSLGALAIMAVTIGVYIMERVLKLKMECLPMAYCVGFGVLLLLIRRGIVYDTEGLSSESMQESEEYGCVICDSKLRFAGADEFARKWFPEINNLNIDYVIKDFSSDFLKQIDTWVKDKSAEQIVLFEREGKIIEAKHSINKRHYGSSVHCIILRDDSKNQKYLKLIRDYNENLENEVEQKTRRLKQVQDDIIISMASIVENRDNNTGGHIKRTSDVVKIFVNHLKSVNYSKKLTDEFAEYIIKAAPLHDFGKIGIPDDILNKPGKFTDEEYAVMKTHAEKGAVIVARILENSDDLVFKNIAVNVAHYHHEKWNGAGYPMGLAGKEIPFEARVMALADVFDALVSKRVYKEQFNYDKAFGIIEESCGTHFDPNLCAEFLKCREALVELYDGYEE